ncbi:MAG: ubiquitin-like small modifier protein 1 [Thermoleophilia bacterium]|nr:MoaD/ThiS family protein [Actinomycetota bacterium]MDA8166658.1 MoaD/ThiS family protein [Actinomycetota bacterium]
MSVQVRIPSQLRQVTQGESLIEMDPATVGGIIMELENRNPGIAERLLEDGELRRFINIYVDGDDIRFADGLATEVSDGSEVSIVPAVAGG